MGATPHTVLYRFFRNFTGFFGHGLKICMWLRYNPQIIFCYFFRKLNLVIFQALYITKSMDRLFFVTFYRKLKLAFFRALSITM